MRYFNGKNIYWIIIMFVCNSNQIIFSQTPKFRYDKLNYVMIPTTDSLYDSGEYRKSIEYNLTQLDSTGQLLKVKGYLLAQNHALLGEADSAFHYLNYYIDSIHPSDYRSVYVEQDFELLRENEIEWDKILKRIEDLYVRELDSSMNKELAVKLFRMEIEDQKYRAWAIASCRRGEYNTFIQEDIMIGIKNKKELKKIIRKYGFPTPSKVGYTASTGAFLILQHSLIEDKYYYMVKEAYQKNDFHPELYALFTDRWLEQHGKKQIYGTQFRLENSSNNPVSILSPVEDFKNVNLRRSELGLPSIEEYAKRMNGMIPEEYYKGN
jgi:hypothetical protein